ncbi:MAG: hypothetical protein HY966_00900 [Ignavibacteriales bacterium]|nr:hypothetical protein [Ignavibacteriales bacterium]
MNKSTIAQAETRRMTKGQQKSILIFSPDADLARTLLLILEEEYQIVRETEIGRLEGRIASLHPALILVDLSAYSPDIVRQLEVVKHTKRAIPLIILRGYSALTPSMNETIEELADMVFYKPADVDMITQAIEDLLK